MKSIYALLFFPLLKSQGILFSKSAINFLEGVGPVQFDNSKGDFKNNPLGSIDRGPSVLIDLDLLITRNNLTS